MDVKEIKIQQLGVHYFEAQMPEKQCVFLMISATGVRQRYYSRFASYCSQKGIHVYTFDYTGIGKSLNHHIKDCKVSMSDWALKDVSTMITYIKQQHPNHRLIIIGQSLGGQIAGLNSDSLQADGLVFVASQSGFWKLWPFPKNLIFYGNLQVMRLTTKLFGYFPGKKLQVMENLPAKVALEWAQWCLSPNYLFDFYPIEQQYHHQFTVPLLSYSFSDDNSAPLAAVEWLNARYSGCEVTHKHYQPNDLKLKTIGHFGFFKESCSVLWDDLLSEIEARG